jgi:hypothetical protein
MKRASIGKLGSKGYAGVVSQSSAGVVLKKFTGNVDPFYFVSEGNLDALLQLLRQGEKVCKVNQTRWSGFTMLHRAAQMGYTDICQILLKHGADLNMRSVRGWYTPLHLALGAGYTETAQYLLQSGAKPWTKCKDGLDAFDYAAKMGFKELSLELRSKLVKIEMTAMIARTNAIVGQKFVPTSTKTKKALVERVERVEREEQGEREREVDEALGGGS